MNLDRPKPRPTQSKPPYSEIPKGGGVMMAIAQTVLYISLIVLIYFL